MKPTVWIAVLMVAVGGCNNQAPPEILVPPPLPRPPTSADSDEVLDQFVQSFERSADVLFVPDCTTDLEALADALPSFFGHLFGSGVDYRIGVAEPLAGEESPLRIVSGTRFLEPSSPNPLQVFTAMTATGSCDPDTHEPAPLDRILDVVDEKSAFLRDGVALHTFVASGADEQSVATLEDFVASYPGAPVKSKWGVSMTAVVPADAKRWQEVAGQIDVDLIAAEAVDWSRILSAFGAQVLNLHRAFFLSDKPELTTLDVQVLAPVAFAPDTFEVVTLDLGVHYVHDAVWNAIRFHDTYVPFRPLADPGDVHGRRAAVETALMRTLELLRNRQNR